MPIPNGQARDSGAMGLSDSGRRQRQYASTHPIAFVIQAILLVGVLGFAIFQDIRPGIAGAIGAGILGWVWWRPEGPGQRRAARERGE